MTVLINSPDDGGTITSPTDVVATISGGIWTVDYSLDADEDIITRTWTTIASGSGAASNAMIARFDPTLLLNGTYLVRLTSQDGGANLSMDQIAVTVRGQQKIGNFTLAFNDLSVPVAGLPIQVIRSYDSRDKRVGDFGVGWTLGIKNVRVESPATWASCGTRPSLPASFRSTASNPLDRRP